MVPAIVLVTVMGREYCTMSFPLESIMLTPVKEFEGLVDGGFFATLTTNEKEPVLAVRDLRVALSY